MPETKLDPCKRQCWRSRREVLPQGIVARTSNLEMRPLYINNRIPKNPLKLLSIAAGVKKKEIVKKGVAAKLTSDNPPQQKYDVFVSFRGEDIRPGFLSHLVKDLHVKQIYAFVDDKLQRGDEIWSSLVRAIEGSVISVIIFSKDYASSRWCLDELVEIIKCRKRKGQIVVPVFYNVEPTDVRHRKGSYGKALAKHERESNFPFFWWKKYNSTRVQKWRNALNTSANLSGITSSNFRDDAALIEDIVNLVLTRLSKHPVDSKGLIGIDKAIALVESLLHQESKDVRVIGIWGMGGIGKTTIAEETFNKLSSEYESGCFLANVREESRRHGIISLKEKLFSTLLAGQVKINTPNAMSNNIERRIGRMKVLIVLDDVNDSDQLEKLFGTHDWFGPGSRIIVTTRDRQVLIANKVDDIYQVGVLSYSESLVLFNLNAFNQSPLEMEYYELSERVVNYAKGIPLVLKVLAHLLRAKGKEVWESQLDKLKNMPSREVHDVMKLSYDDLDHKEQNIFLDLACFFRGWNTTKVDDIKILLKNHESDNSVVVGLERLKDKALITISKNNVVSMHDILQEMAWEIVRQESSDPGGRSHLRDPDVIHEVLLNDKGTEAIRSIQVDLSAFRQLKLSSHIFAKMSKLHFLHMDGKHDSGYLNHLPQGLQYLPTELRYLRWVNYPLKSLPEKFSAEKLVIFYLIGSSVEKLWDGVQELPDFSKASNLEVLRIDWCFQFTNVHPSIFSLDKLEQLDLSYCISLIRLATETHLRSLRYLDLSCCLELKEFSVTSENMIHLDLSFTGLNALPSSFGRQRKLEILLLLGSCIQSLPSSIKNLTRLQYVNVGRCENLRTLPELPPSLETLNAGRCTSLMTVLFPSTAAEQFKENRKQVMFWNCLNLDENSLMAIALNAQINMMKLAYQHISVPEYDYVENYDDYNYHRDPYQAEYVYVYPGSRVPEWFEYKTTNDHIIIDLSSAPPSLFGFIFCFIIGKGRYSYYLKFSISIIDGEDEGKKDSVEMYKNINEFIESDHVCVMYNQQCSRYLNSIAKNLTRFEMKVTASTVTNGPKDWVLLKGLGVSPINTSAYHNFMQQMELRDSN